jgi:hypothetical protein
MPKTPIEAKRLRIKQRIVVFKYKLAHPCKCGENNPNLLELHHQEFEIKHHRLKPGVRGNSRGLSGLSQKAFNEESKKCIVLCVRCHRLETAKQQNWATSLEQLEQELFNTYNT